jgi:hypothetical protein
LAGAPGLNSPLNAPLNGAILVSVLAARFTAGLAVLLR